jgi:hypothetical protein
LEITKVYEGDEGRSVFFDTKQKSENLLLKDNNSHFNILFKTDNNYWIIVEKTPLFVGEGRVETESILLYLPDTKEINIESYDPSLSNLGIRLEKKDGIECLVTSRKGENEDIFIPLTDLLKGPAPVKQVTADEKKEPVNEPVPVISLKFGKEDNQLGQGLTEKRLEGGKSIDAVPSFTVFNKQLYIVDAINFRVLVYNYSGEFIRKISYQQNNTKGDPVVIKDIAVDNDFVYLFSFYEAAIYVVDAKTEDVITIITGSETANKKFNSVYAIYLNKDESLIIPDDSLYIYKRNNLDFNLLKTIRYKGSNQFVYDQDGDSITVEADGKNYSVYRSDGGLIGKYEFSHNTGGARIIGTDEKNNIYIRTEESQVAGAQNSDASYVKVITPGGEIKSDFPVDTWPGGAMTRYIVVDNDGLVFVASFDFTGAASPDDPPTGFIIKRLN